MKMPQFTAERALCLIVAQSRAPGTCDGAAKDGRIVPQYFLIPVGPGRCAAGDYAGGACWYYGIVSC